MTINFLDLFHHMGRFLADNHQVKASVADLPQLENKYSYGLTYNGMHSIADTTFIKERPAYTLYALCHTLGHVIQHRRGTLDVDELTHWRYDTISALHSAEEREERIRMHYELDYDATCIALTLLRDAHAQGYLAISDEDFSNVLIPSMIAHYRHDVSLHIGTLENGEPPVFGTDITHTPCHPWVAARDLVIDNQAVENLPAKSTGMPLVFHVHPVSQHALAISEATDMQLRQAAQTAYQP